MPIFHQRLPANAKGRDYVVGDLHGCLDLLQAELDSLAFDRTKDRLFSVGDLADRGPDSMGCLRLLEEPWFHAVRGNHEDMLLGYMRQALMPYDVFSGDAEAFMHNGGGWVLSLSESDAQALRHALLPRIRQLPHVITVGEGSARFHVAHAELMAGGGKAQAILTDDLVREETLSRMQEQILWGRRLIRTFEKKQAARRETRAGELLIGEQAMHPGLSLTYVGHTPLPQMVLHQSHLFIDRGGFLRRPDSKLQVLGHDEVMTWLPAESMQN